MFYCDSASSNDLSCNSLCVDPLKNTDVLLVLKKLFVGFIFVMIRLVFSHFFQLGL